MTAVPAENLRGLTDEQVWDVLHDSTVESTGYTRAVLELQMRVAEKHLKAADESAAGGARLANLTNAFVRATWTLVAVTAVLVVVTAIPVIKSHMAPAGAAWIVWNRLSLIGETDWTPQGAHFTKADCDEAVRSFTASVTSKMAESSFYCLPDAVDPRGPKGK